MSLSVPCPRPRGALDRIDNRLIAGAAAIIAGKVLADLFAIRHRGFLQQSCSSPPFPPKRGSSEGTSSPLCPRSSCSWWQAAGCSVVGCRSSRRCSFSPSASRAETPPRGSTGCAPRAPRVADDPSGRRPVLLHRLAAIGSSARAARRPRRPREPAYRSASRSCRRSTPATRTARREGRTRTSARSSPPAVTRRGVWLFRGSASPGAGGGTSAATRARGVGATRVGDQFLVVTSRRGA